MATYAGEIITRFGADLSALSRGFQQAESMGSRYASQMETHSTRVSSGFSGMGRSLLAAGAGVGGWAFAAKAGVDAAIGLGKALFSSSASMEQTRIAFVGLMGGAKQADAMLRQLQNFAAKTPFEFPELAQDTQMLIGMGVAAKDVIPWMTAIGDAAAGIGAGAEGANSITRALGQMQAKTKISGEEMMQLTEAGIPAWRILAQSMGLTVAQVQDLSQKGQLGQDAINKLVAGMEKMYGGQMKNQATTFNGLLSTLKDNAGMALRAFVGPLFEAAKNGLARLTDLLGSPAFQNFASGAAKWISDAFQKISQYVGPVVSAIGQFIGSLTQGNGPASQFGGIIQQVANIFGGNFLNIIQQVSGFVTGSLIPAIQGLMPTFQRIGDLFVTTIIPAFLQIWPVINNVASVIRQVLFAALSAILPVIVNMANFLSSLLVPAIKFISPFIVEAAKAVGQFAADIGVRVIPIIKQLAEFINTAVNTIKAVWVAVWPTLGPILKGVWDMIVGIIKIAWSVISGIFKVALDLLSGNWKQAWTDIKNMFSGIWEGIKTYIRGAWEIIQGIFNAARNAVVSIITGLWNTVTSIWNNGVRTVTNFVNGIRDTIIRVFNGVRDTVGGIFRSAINNIITFLRGGQTAIQNFVNFFVDKINDVARAFTQKDLLKRVSLQLVPYLAHGSKDFAGGLAIVGEAGRELVYLPEHSRVLPNKETERLIASGAAPVPHFAGGIGEWGRGGFIEDALSGFLSGGISGVVNAVLKNIFAGAPGLGIFAQVASGLLAKVAGWLGDWVKNVFSTTLGTLGSAGALPMQQRGKFILPPGGGYGELYWYGRHQGMDLQFPQGTPLREAIGGVVSPHTGWYDWGGELDILLTALPGIMERYLHLSAIFAKAGQVVRRGDLVGLTGGGTVASGLGYWSTGAHLHVQYDRGAYNRSYDPLAVWGALGIWKPFAKGGILSEKVLGVGATTGKPYLFGEGGPEQVSPLATSTSRMIDLLERIERLLSQDGRVTEYQVVQSLGKLLTSGVR